MNTFAKHLKTICAHKYYVGIECFKRGLIWQGIVHDLSKFSPVEFSESAKYFQGNRSPVGEAKRVNGYSFAWLHHKGRNKHHWEYYVDYIMGKTITVEIPYKYVQEMCADMIGASKAYLKGDYDKVEPLRYFLDHQSYWIINKKSKDLLYTMLLEEAKK